MAVQDPVHLVNQIDKLLVKWFITSTSTDDIERGVLNNKRRKLIYVANAIVCCDVFLWTIAFAAPENSSLHFYFLNGVHALGYLGRVFSGTIIVGHTMCVLHSLVILYYEKRGALTPVSSIKHLFEKLKNPFPNELKKLTFSLKALCYFPLIHFAGTLCVQSISTVGAVMTALSFQSWYFALAYIPRGIFGCLSSAHVSQSFAIVHLLITNSTIFLGLCLDRVTMNLSGVSSLSPGINTADRLHASRLTKTNLLDLDSILNDVNDHNRCIKHWLKDELICVGVLVSLIIVFCIEGSNYYEKAIFGITVFSIVFVLAISFGHAVYLHVKIRSIAKLLHSLQTKTQIHVSLLRRHSEPMFFLLEKRNESFADVIKTKYEILRLIHRISSPYLRIGFTEGNGESFSPESVASVISTIVTTPLMFLNAKYSSL